MTVYIAGLHTDPFNDGHYYAALHTYNTDTYELGPQEWCGKPCEDPISAFNAYAKKEGLELGQLTEAFEVLEAETDGRQVRLPLWVEMVEVRGPHEDDIPLCHPRFRTYRQMLEYFRSIQSQHGFKWSAKEIGWVDTCMGNNIRVRAYYLDSHLVDPFNLERPASADCFHKESIERAMSLWDQPDVPVVPDQKIKLPLVEFSPLDETWVDDSDPEAFV